MQTLDVLTLGSSAGGGDWPPLVAASLALQQRGHQIRYLGDEPLAKAVEGAGLALTVVSAGLDLPSALQAWEVEYAENPDAPNPLLAWVRNVLPNALELARSRMQVTASLPKPSTSVCQWCSFLGIEISQVLRHELRR